MSAGTLYVVATPIGNMGDISPRARETLEKVDFVLAEDTRVGSKLLSLLGMRKPLVSYYEHNKDFRGEAIIRRLLDGESAALTTDAGTPCISDPGMELVRDAHLNSVPVVPVPGACAAVTAISASGIDCRRFVFEGFLDKNASHRKKRLQVLSREDRAVVLYVTPHEIERVIPELLEAFGDRTVALCREITKLNEQICLTTVGALPEALSAVKGEFVLVMDKCRQEEDAFWKDMTVPEHVDYYISLGNKKMDAIKLVAADRRTAKGEIYKEILSDEK